MELNPKLKQANLISIIYSGPKIIYSTIESMSALIFQINIGHNNVYVNSQVYMFTSYFVCVNT